MEVIQSNQQAPEEEKKFEILCEICDRPAAEIKEFQCDKEECSLCNMSFDKFVCSECTHTKTLEEMEAIYIKKHDLDAKEVVSSSKSPENESQETIETKNITEAIEDMTESFSDFEESEQGDVQPHDTTSSTAAHVDDGDKQIYSTVPDDTDEEEGNEFDSSKIREQYERVVDEIEQISKPGDEQFERYQRVVKEMAAEQESSFEKTCKAVEEMLKKEDEEACVSENKYKVKFSKILEEIVTKKTPEEPVEATVILRKNETNKPVDEEFDKEEYEKTLQALEKLSQLEDETIPSSPTLLKRQNGVEEIIDYSGPIPLRVKRSDKPNFYDEVSETESIEEEELLRAEQLIANGGKTQIKYYEDYQEDDDSGTEADMEERLMQTHQEEILEGIPEDDEISSATNHLAEGLVTATLTSATKELDRQDSALTYTSVDKFYEERDFANVSSDYIRGTSLEEHSIGSTATPLIDEEVIRPGSVIEYEASELDSETDSEYENEYYPLYEHIKAQKNVNRDIRMIRGMLEEKFNIKIVSNEIDDVVKAKEEILVKFGLDLGYHEVYNYMERNRLNKRLERGVDTAFNHFNSIGFDMKKCEPTPEESALETRIMKICEYVEQGKTVDDMPNSRIDEAVKLACQYFEEKMNLKMVQKNRSWRQKQDDVIEMMNRYRKQNPNAEFDDTSASESEEEEVYSEMTEEISRSASKTPISFRTVPVSDHIEAIDEGYERVRKSFGGDHEVRLNAMVQITDDLKENIEKLSKLFPGKIKFEIETIPKTVKDTITEFGAEIKQDLNVARHVVEKSTPSNEKFDIGVFFKSLFSKFKAEQPQETA